MMDGWSCFLYSWTHIYLGSFFVAESWFVSFFFLEKSLKIQVVVVGYAWIYAWIWLDMVGWVVGLVLATGEDNLMIKPGGFFYWIYGFVKILTWGPF